LRRLRADVAVVSRATPLLVPLIEEGLLQPEILRPVIGHYLADLRGVIDTLILGCTHYPLLTVALAEYFEGRVALVDSAQATAVAVAELLGGFAITSPAIRAGRTEICVTDAPERVGKIAATFLQRPGVEIRKVEVD
jgi:glutamate racemase